MFFGCFRLKYVHEADFARFHVQATSVFLRFPNQPVFGGFRFLHLDGDRSVARPMGIKPNLHWVSWHSKVGKLEFFT